MKDIFKFLWYCIKCVLDLFSAIIGHVDENYELIDGLVGFITLIFIMIIVFLFFYFTGIIRFIKK